MIADVEKETQSRMQQAVDHAREDLSTIRTGRAHPAMFNRLNADYYGAPTPLQQLATFNSPDPRTMLITPFDRSAIAAIEKVIREADLGVNPSNDGNSIRVVMPQLMEERRKEYVKQAKSKAEDGRVSVRGVRRKAKDQLDRLKKDGEASEDDVDRAEKSLDATTKAHTEQIDKMLATKESELLTI